LIDSIVVRRDVATSHRHIRLTASAPRFSLLTLFLLAFTIMADDDATTTTAAKAVTFRINHLARLRGFNHIALDGKLVRIKSDINETSGKF